MFSFKNLGGVKNKVHIINDHETVENLVINNLNLVHLVLRTYFHISRESNPDLYSELESVGYEGLIKASQHFDKTKGCQFSTYAVPTIQGYIGRYKRDQTALIRVPRKMFNYKRLYIKETNKGKTIEEICSEHHIKQSEMKEALNFYITNLEEPIYTDKEGNALTLMNTIPSDVNVENQVEYNLERKWKYEFLKYILTPNFFKLVNVVIKNDLYRQEDIANKLNCSQAEVSRKLRSLTEVVSPNMHKYYLGEITFEQMMININSNKAAQRVIKKDIKESEWLKMANENSFEYSIQDCCDNNKIYDDLKNWILEHPYNRVNLETIKSILTKKQYNVCNMPDSLLTSLEHKIRDEIIDMDNLGIVENCDGWMIAVKSNEPNDIVKSNEPNDIVKSNESNNTVNSGSVNNGVYSLFGSKYRKQIKALEDWLKNHPNENLRISEVLKENELKIKPSDTSRVRKYIYDHMKLEGYNIVENRIHSKLFCLMIKTNDSTPENFTQEIINEKGDITLEECENAGDKIILNLKDVPLENHNYQIDNIVESILNIIDISKTELYFSLIVKEKNKVEAK